ncbi:hypothetical protein CC86DRAFT_418562 [Ophiobolus disseminans]|uniref:Uncharacterized protein n=1 Tax=Ophiobolus disseminans TaxID=1469910 RepID=A0A6A6ZYJ4_9PLEO|nr:hypothetical protein CC86DRAFT_418562 [Ophiobolus disseminans]
MKPYQDHILARIDKPSDEFFEKVCREVWSWPNCTTCDNKGHCSTVACCWERLEDVQPYLRFFGESSCGSMPSNLFEVNWSIRSEDDILSVIRIIRYRPGCARQKLMVDYFANYCVVPSYKEQERAFDLAMYMLTMIHCSSRSAYMHSFHSFRVSIMWKSLESAIEFVKSSVPICLQITNYGDLSVAPDVSARLLKNATMRLRGTNDLDRHLFYDSGKRTVFVFHLVYFLKESLNAPLRDNSSNCTILPRQIILETLRSLQLLFPGTDMLSRDILMREGFDPACMVFGMAIPYSDGYDTQFTYWGARMRVIAEVVKAGRPEPVTLVARESIPGGVGQISDCSIYGDHNCRSPDCGTTLSVETVGRGILID